MSSPCPSPPRWFRVALVAVAVAVLCSCRASGPAYRMAEEPTGQRLAQGLPPAAAPPAAAALMRDNQVQQSGFTAPLPTHLDGAQMARARAVPAGYPMEACGPGGCSCCGDGNFRGPNDEYLCDGGDAQYPAAVIKSGAAVGIEPEDSIAHYDTIDGRTVVTPSNRVCIYAPRFAAIRQVVDPRALADVDAAEGAIRDLAPDGIGERLRPGTSLAQNEPVIHRAQAPPSLLRNRDKPGALNRDRRVAVTLGSLAPYCDLQVVHTGELVGVEIAQIARSSLVAITWTGDQAAQVLLNSRKAQANVSVKTPGTIYLLVEPNNPKLRLIKLADRGEAQPGEEVEFTLRYDNVGDRVIGNVTIIDSLTTRLHYVADSQKSTRDANFSTQANDGDSLVLRWEIIEPLEPGQGGVIQFRTKVR